MYHNFGHCDHHSAAAPKVKWLEAKASDKLPGERRARDVGLRPVRFCPDCGKPISPKKVWPISLVYHMAASKALAENGITQKAPRRVIHQAIDALDDGAKRTEEEQQTVYVGAFRHTTIPAVDILKALQTVTAL